ncbi:MAG TPA: hypothetical protein VEF04_19260 [Blastocatellia bacterium]|nr:hypothetical protein [Blastocatellia bacterium]
MAIQINVTSKQENFIWDYFRQQLERAGKGDAAIHLQHFLKARLRERVQEGELFIHKFDLYHRVSDFSVELNAQDGSLMGWYFSKFADNSTGDLPEDDVLEAATQAAEPPPNAQLTTSEYEEMGDQKVFIARWSHVENGIPVERDYIQVMVNGKTGKPFMLSRKWHQLSFAFSER